MSALLISVIFVFLPHAAAQLIVGYSPRALGWTIGAWCIGQLIGFIIEAADAGDATGAILGLALVVFACASPLYL